MPAYMQSSQNPFAGSPRGGNREYWLSQQPRRRRGPYSGGTGGMVQPSGAQQRAATAGGGGLAGAYDKAQQDANQANLQRYANLLEQGGWRYGEGMNLAGQMGESQATEINRVFDNRLGAVNQDMVGRGLSNTTIKPTMEMAVDRERMRAMGELKDKLLGRQLGVHERMSGDVAGIMERRTDQGPDMNALLQMAQMYGQGMQASGPMPGGAGGMPMMAGGGAYGSMTPQYGMPRMPMLPMGRGGGGQPTAGNRYQSADTVARLKKAAALRYGQKKPGKLPAAAPVRQTGGFSGGAFFQAPQSLTPGSLFPQRRWT